MYINSDVSCLIHLNGKSKKARAVQCSKKFDYLYVIQYSSYQIKFKLPLPSTCKLYQKTISIILVTCFNSDLSPSGKF